MKDLIRSNKDPGDARRKIFCINAEFLGELSCDKEAKFDIEDYFAKLPQLKDPFEFYRLNFTFVKGRILERRH